MIKYQASYTKRGSQKVETINGFAKAGEDSILFSSVVDQALSAISIKEGWDGNEITDFKIKINYGEENEQESQS